MPVSTSDNEVRTEVADQSKKAVPGSPGARIEELKRNIDAEQPISYTSDDAIADLLGIAAKVKGLPGDVLAIGKIQGAIQKLQQGKEEKKD